MKFAMSLDNVITDTRVSVMQITEKDGNHYELKN